MNMIKKLHSTIIERFKQTHWSLLANFGTTWNREE